MTTYNRYNKTTTEAAPSRKRAIAASGILAVLVIAVAVTVTAVTLTAPRGEREKDEEVITSIVFGLPLAQYTTILKNSSLNELQFNETMRRWESHKGISIEAPLGTPVLATYAGTIASITTHRLHGRTVTIEHRDGLRTVYSNLDNNVLVTQGQRIEKGHQIGTVGQTGSIEFTNVPHLRIMVYKDGKRIDPNDYIDFPAK